MMRSMGPLTALTLGLLISTIGVTSCARGAGGSGLGPTGRDGPAAVTATASLAAVAAGDRLARVDWRGVPTGFDVFLFHSTDLRRLYDGAPLLSMPAGDHVVLENLATGVDHFFGLALRDPSSAGNEIEPVGVALRARLNPIVYVDAAAPSGGDGTSPRSAFATIGDALQSGPAGGRNIWVREGTYTGTGFALAEGDHLYGGFPGTFGAPFELADRLADGGGTVVQADAGTALFSAAGASQSAVIDGFVLDGRQLNFTGIEVDNTPAEIRSVVARGFRGRGFSLQNSSRFGSIEIQLAAISAIGNGNEGLFAQGAIDVRMHGCRFEGNQQEGFDVDDLVALEGETASLHATSCLFHGNGAEGMDLDMSAPDSPGTPSGRFSIVIRGCTFSRNGTTGLLLDEEFELASLWSARIIVQECLIRDNGGVGLLVDDDGIATVLVHRCKISANAEDGMRLSSESQTGFAVVSTSAFAGNLGPAIRATFGNKAVLASHCVFAGNLGGGIVSEVVESSATSCVAWQQGTPWVGTRQKSCVTIDDPAATVFVHPPRATARVLLHDGAAVTLESAASVAVDDVVEIGDDGVARVVTAVAGNTLTLDPPPSTVRLPASLGRFSAGSNVTEDWTLAGGSPATGAGMRRPGGPAVDAGVFGAPDGANPGDVDGVPRPLYWTSQTIPALKDPVPAGRDIVIAFSAEIDPDSVTDRIRAVQASGNALAISLLATGDVVIVSPPGSGWGNEPFSLELHAGIRDAHDVPITAPLSIPLRTN